MRLLGIFVAGRVLAGSNRDRRVSKQPDGLLPGLGQRLVAQGWAVGAHVGDETAVVEPLGRVHHPLGAEFQSAPGLLQGAGGEGRGRPGPGLALADLQHHGVLAVQVAAQRPGLLVRHHQHVGPVFQHAVLREVAGLRERLTVRALAGFQVSDGRQESGPGLHPGADQPVGPGSELHPRHLAYRQQHQGRALNPPGAEPAADGVPQQGADPVADQSVDHPPGLLGGHQRQVDRTQRPDGGLQCLPGDLVKHHPQGVLQPQHLREVPGDALTLAVVVGRQDHPVGLPGQ